MAEGVLTSVTAGSLAGRFGEQVRRFALSLFERGLVHNVASDAHDLANARRAWRRRSSGLGWARSGTG